MRGRYNTLEEKRQEALARRDAPAYARLCDELGLKDVEAPELHDLATAEEVYWRKKRESEKKENYLEFLEEAERLTVRDHFMSAGQKRNLLQEYFPGRFGEEGTQDISNYQGKKVGALFQIIVESCRKKRSKKLAKPSA